MLGVAPQLAVTYVVEPALGSMGLSTDLRVSWLGLAVAGGSWYATAGLVLALSPRPLLPARAGASVAPPGVVLLFAAAPPAPSYWLVVRLRGRPTTWSVPPLGPAGAALAPARRRRRRGRRVLHRRRSLAPGGRLLASDFSISLSRVLAPFYSGSTRTATTWRCGVRRCG